MSVSRRDFLKQGTAAGLLAGTGALPARLEAPWVRRNGELDPRQMRTTAAETSGDYAHHWCSRWR